MLSEEDIQKVFDAAIRQRKASQLVGNWATDEHWLMELKSRGIKKETKAEDFNSAMKNHPNFGSKIEHQNKLNDSRVALVTHGVTSRGKTISRQRFYYDSNRGFPPKTPRHVAGPTSSGSSSQKKKKRRSFFPDCESVLFRSRKVKNIDWKMAEAIEQVQSLRLDGEGSNNTARKDGVGYRPPKLG